MRIFPSKVKKVITEPGRRYTVGTKLITGKDDQSYHIVELFCPVSKASRPIAFAQEFNFNVTVLEVDCFRDTPHNVARVIVDASTKFPLSTKFVRCPHIPLDGRIHHIRLTRSNGRGDPNVGTRIWDMPDTILDHHRKVINRNFDNQYTTQTISGVECYLVIRKRNDRYMKSI